MRLRALVIATSVKRVTLFKIAQVLEFFTYCLACNEKIATFNDLSLGIGFSILTLYANVCFGVVGKKSSLKTKDDVMPYDIGVFSTSSFCLSIYI